MFDFLTKPKGPNFAKAEPVTLEFSGTKVHFKVPNYSYNMINQDDSDRLPTTYNLYDLEQYQSTLDGYGSSPRMKDGDIGGIGCFDTTWSFDKALFGGEMDSGTLNFGVALNYIPWGESLFKPQNMENALIEKMNIRYGPRSCWAGTESGGRRFSCPLNWSVHEFSGLKWIHCYVEQKRVNGGWVWWAVPITDEHFLIFTYRDTNNNSKRLIECFGLLAKQVVSSCVIEYSEDAKRQMEKAEDEGLGEDYSQSREPLAWEEYDLHPEKYKFKSS